MNKMTFLSILLIIVCLTDIAITQPHLIITGVYDGPLSGGTPKGVELYVISNISDLSAYGLGAANNGDGTDGEEYTFPTDAVTAGDYIYVSYEDSLFTAWFGSAPDYSSGAMSINGDDAIELFYNNAVVDVFGDINIDGNGEKWEYMDGWAYSKPNRGHNTTFNDAHWTYSGVNAWDNDAGNNNASSSPSFPIGTFSYTDGSLPVELTYFKGFSRNGNIQLIWVTESEIDNLGFLLERRAGSIEHGGWKTIADYKTNGALIGQGSVTHRTNYKFIDRNVITGQLYHYQLADVDYDGKITYHKPITVKVRPPDIKVNQAFPNPFNPVTTVKISIDLPQQLTVRVFDITGRRLKTLIDSHLSAGEYTIAWDGTNRNNLPVASGVYFLQIKSHELNSIQKLLLTR